jgi:hypothetical protein
MLHNALGEDAATAHCGENSCSKWQQNLLHAFSRTVPVAKAPLLKERGEAPAESNSLSLWVQSTSQARNQTSNNAQTNKQD